MDEYVRFEVWKQYRNTADAPYRRQGDRRHALRWVSEIHAGGSQGDWSRVLPLIGRNAVIIRTRGFRHPRGVRIVQVLIGSRAFLRAHVGR
jgi:hypothetical protein